MISAKEISSKKFEKAAIGGYKTDDVDQFLSSIAIELAQIQKDKDDCEKKIDVLADKVREYMKDEDALKDALLGAQRQSHHVIDEAQIVANRIILEANEKADKIISQTQLQHESEKIALSSMQKEVSDFKARLLSLYKSHLDLITAMPDVDDSDSAENTSQVVNQPVSEAKDEHVSSDPKRTGYPFSSPSVSSNESRYSDLKFGHNSK